MKYGIFAINQPEDLNFAGEEIPIYSSEIWERIDNELLKNTYWLMKTSCSWRQTSERWRQTSCLLLQTTFETSGKQTSRQ